MNYISGQTTGVDHRSYSSQHSPHSLSYFHVIFILPYVVKFYAYVNMLGRNDLITRKMVTIKERGGGGVIPYIFSSSIALLSSLLSCTFYLLDLKTISSVDILEMT